jgi:hypothetical protein
MHRLIRGAVAVALLGGCAHMAAPPGGPADASAPRLIAVFPDSLRVLEGFKGNAEFRFNEVVSEGSVPNFGQGTGDFEKLILLSPDTLVPHVEWHRDRITVRPRNGWQPNTVYRIELMPGIRDLSNNESKVPAQITFATGGPVPSRVLVGRAIDWTTRRSAPLVLVEAMHLPDRAVYRTHSDSLGRFHLDGLPDGEYLVGATIDKNRDARRNRDELWDTLRVAPDVSVLREIWMFPRDSAAPRAQKADRADSTWAVLTLSQPVRPDLFIAGDSIRVVHLPDSTSLAPLYAVSEARYDSLKPRKVVPPPAPDSLAKADSLKPPAPKPAAPVADSVRADEPAEKRPILSNKLFVHTNGGFFAGQKYWIEVKGVRSAGGSTGSVSQLLNLPEVKAPAAAKPDSNAKKPVVKPDSGGRGGGGGGRQ